MPRIQNRSEVAEEDLVFKNGFHVCNIIARSKNQLEKQLCPRAVFGSVENEILRVTKFDIYR